MAEVDGVQAHILMAARGQGNKAAILPIRGWTSEEWNDGVARLVERGWRHLSALSEPSNRSAYHADMFTWPARDARGISQSGILA